MLFCTGGEEMAKRKLICPKCSSDAVLTYLYGEPCLEYSPEPMKHSKYTLGGCCVKNDSPLYVCQCCGYNWGRFDGVSILPSIKSFEAYVGGFGAPNCNIKADIRKGKLIRKYVNYNSEESIDDEIDITPKEWQILLRILKNTDFEYWANKYDDPYVCDGTQWQVEIQLESRKKIQKSGSNMFPGRWEQFCRGITKLTGVSFR